MGMRTRHDLLRARTAPLVEGYAAGSANVADNGGDPACWADRVCDECGLLDERAERDGRCPHCGATDEPPAP
jgi:rubrerythrin